MVAALTLSSTPRNETDYIVDHVNHDRVWLTWDKFSVCIHKADEGLICDIYKCGAEDAGEIVSCYALDSEVEDDDRE